MSIMFFLISWLNFIIAVILIQILQKKNNCNSGLKTIKCLQLFTFTYTVYCSCILMVDERKKIIEASGVVYNVALPNM